MKLLRALRAARAAYLRARARRLTPAVTLGLLPPRYTVAECLKVMHGPRYSLDDILEALKRATDL